MKFLKIVLILALIPLLTASSAEHKFYVSITKVELNEDSNSVQMISKIFIDDLEAVIRERYNPDITLGDNEPQGTSKLVEQYFLQKFHAVANGREIPLEYIGKEYDIDVVLIYVEIPNVAELEKIEFESKLLFDKFEEQQNIIHCKVGKKRKSLLLDVENPKGVLNFR